MLHIYNFIFIYRNVSNNNQRDTLDTRFVQLREYLWHFDMFNGINWDIADLGTNRNISFVTLFVADVKSVKSQNIGI